MKIGILTLPFNNNYGGLLQSYALQSFLKKQGHEVWLIKRVPELSAITTKVKIKKLIKALLWREREEIAHNMRAFEDQYMQKTDVIDDHGKFHLLNKYEFDAYVVGSDQVWRFDYTQARSKNYFLDFVTSDAVKRLAFSASFGIDEWQPNEEETAELTKLIHKFDAVSVREKAGVSLCLKYLNCDATLLLDPTFLLKQDEYRCLYTGDEPENKDKILLYLLDHHEAANKIITSVSEYLSKRTFSVGGKTSMRFPKKTIHYPPVSHWIKGFDDASFVITDSFHGCVFSIIFKKPFIVLDNQKRGMSRFTSLLSTFNLSEQLIYRKNVDYSQINGIDFSNIESIVNANLQKSIFFISRLNM
jgi:hypothetical protein